MASIGPFLVCLLRIVANKYIQNDATNIKNILQTKIPATSFPLFLTQKDVI